MSDMTEGCGTKREERRADLSIGYDLFIAYQGMFEEVRHCLAGGYLPVSGRRLQVLVCSLSGTLERSGSHLSG